MVALSGLVIDDVLVYDNIEMDPGTLFERAIPLEERERVLAEDEVLAWTCTPTTHYHSTGDAWYTDVAEWPVTLERFASRRLVQDPDLEDRIRFETRRWQQRYVVDVGDGLVLSGSYYVVRGSGGILRNVVAAEVYGTFTEIRSCVIGALRADVRRLESSTIRRLGCWRVETIHSSCVGMATMPSIGSVDASVASIYGGSVRDVSRTVLQGKITTFEPTEDCVILGRRDVI